MNRTIGLVTANFTTDSLGPLVEHRPVASVPFGGRYRLLDFALSNMVNARIQTVGLITPYYYRSIIDHVGAGKEWGLDRKSGGLYVLPGTVYGFREAQGRFLFRDFLHNLSFFRQGDGDYVLISSGALVCNIDYQPMIARHEQAGGGVTLLCRHSKPGESHPGYYISFDETNQVSDITFGRGGDNLFLNSFIIDRTLLLKLARDFENMGHSDFMEILRFSLGNIRVNTYFFDGYVAFMNGIADYMSSSMDLQSRAVRRDLFDPDRMIKTKIHDAPPALYAEGSNVRSSLVASGSVIEGSVENSIIFRSVRVEPGAVVKNSVIMEKCVIKAGAQLENVICDKYATVSAGIKIQGTESNPCVLPKGGVI